MSTISRRRALSGAATAGLGLPLLTSCGDDGGDTGGSDPSTPATSSSDPPKSSAAATTAPGSSAPAGEGISASEVPVGGGIVVPDEQVVVTQPTEGDFRAFTAVCTHAGCIVARVSAEIECDCHGSRFSIEDGSVVGGPAPTPLPAVDVSVDGDRVVVG